jgi:Zn-dependent oligopeptidase
MNSTVAVDSLIGVWKNLLVQLHREERFIAEELKRANSTDKIKLESQMRHLKTSIQDYEYKINTNGADERVSQYENLIDHLRNEERILKEKISLASVHESPRMQSHMKEITKKIDEYQDKIRTIRVHTPRQTSS